MNDEGQDSRTIYSFAQVDFCSKYISFALLKLLSPQTVVLLPLNKYTSKIMDISICEFQVQTLTRHLYFIQ